MHQLKFYIVSLLVEAKNYFPDTFPLTTKLETLNL